MGKPCILKHALFAQTTPKENIKLALELVLTITILQSLPLNNLLNNLSPLTISALS